MNREIEREREREIDIYINIYIYTESKPGSREYVKGFTLPGVHLCAVHCETGTVMPA